MTNGSFTTGIPFVYWYSWSIGAAVADAYLLGRKIPFANHSLITWSVVAICSHHLKPFAPFSFLFFALLTATAIAKILRRNQGTIILPVFFSKPLRMIGLWSFSIYLLHQPFLELVPKIAVKLSLPDYPQSIVIFALCLCFWFPIVGLSVLWYRAIELPSIAFSKTVVRFKNIGT